MASARWPRAASTCACTSMAAPSAVTSGASAFSLPLEQIQRKLARLGGVRVGAIVLLIVQRRARQPGKRFQQILGHARGRAVALNLAVGQREVSGGGGGAHIGHDPAPAPGRCCASTIAAMPPRRAHPVHDAFAAGCSRNRFRKACAARVEPLALAVHDAQRAQQLRSMQGHGNQTALRRFRFAWCAPAGC